MSEPSEDLLTCQIICPLKISAVGVGAGRLHLSLTRMGFAALCLIRPSEHSPARPRPVATIPSPRLRRLWTVGRPTFLRHFCTFLPHFSLRAFHNLFRINHLQSPASPHGAILPRVPAHCKQSPFVGRQKPGSHFHAPPVPQASMQPILPLSCRGSAGTLNRMIQTAFPAAQHGWSRHAH
jgi:hypothetical protein